MLNPTVLEGLDVSHAMCAPACALFDLPDVHVLTIERHRSSFTLVVETVPPLVGCPSCAVLATGHGRRKVLLHDLPCAGVPVRVRWRKRIYRCLEDACEISTFSELHELAAPRGKLTTRAIAWAVTQLRCHDIAVSALAEMLGVAWNTVWDAITPVIEAQLAAEDRLAGVDALGVDEHVWRHVGPPGTGLVTGIVDHSRGEDGRPRARLLDLVPGRTGAAYGDWLIEQGPTFTSGIRTATLDPFHGYANAIRDELPEAITVLDAFHVVKLGGQVVDEVRRRVQQDTLGHRGRAGDPHHEVTLAWHCYQKLRAVYHARPEQGRRLVAEILGAFPSCPIPEVARLGRTLQRWRSAILAYFDTAGASNGPTEAVNGVIETMRRVARGFRNFDNYRLRALLAAGGHRPWRRTATHTQL
ncbi:ISL3 family transposase [Micrococcus luteus]|uniref:transposase n=1 Tax=Micrococcus luteus TaxID=1270 RepID=UPI00191097C4|nr:ISL3 family transposase [Micrococcus luteus]